MSRPIREKPDKTQRHPFLSRRTAIGLDAAFWLQLPLAALAESLSFDLSPDQAARAKTARNPATIAVIPAGYPFVMAGKRTIATNPGRPPLSTSATDSTTIVGADPDMGALIAQALGLRSVIMPVAWPDWSLVLQSDKIDVVLSNVGVTEARKKRSDFATYRQGL